MTKTQTLSRLTGKIPVQACDTILIGVCDNAVLATCQQASAGRLLVIEPDPDHAAAWRAQEELMVVEALPGHEEGEAQLSVYSLPGLRSTQTPTPAFKATYPGLRVPSTQQIAIRPLAQILAQAGPLADRLRVLW